MPRRPLVLLAALLLAVGLVAPAAANDLPDPADPTAVLELSKTVSADEVGPGDSLVYTLEVGCSAISDVGCRNAITTDVIPAPFVIDSVVPSGPNQAAAPDIDGQNVTVTWTEDIGAGATGMLDNTTSQVAITVHVPDDVSYDFNGVTVTNQALAEATNAIDDPASVPVTINVPLDLATTATKAFDDDTALAAAGTPVTASLTGTNDSNATVETLVIQDPVDPTADPNPFVYLGFTGFGTVTPPEGATGTTYEVFVDGDWVAAPGGDLPPGVDPEDVRGTRVTFTGDIPADATGSVDLDLTTTDEAANVPQDTVVTNTVQSEVTLDGESATDTDPADFTLQANTVAVNATKVFDPDLVLAGESTTVTIGGSNASPFPIDSLTITEPSTGDFPDEYTFGGFTGGIAYPAGATSGTVIYQPSGEEVTFADGATPAPPAGGADSVTSFEIVFTGDIQPGGETNAPFEVDTDPDLDPNDLPITVNNVVAVEGENDGATGEDTQDDDLFIYDEVIEPYIDKQVRPSQIIANPGEIVTVTLQGGTTERPDPPGDTTGTTSNADQIVIQDPLDPVEPNAWWNAFDLNTIAQTPIPADSTLTVYYWDTDADEWVLLDGPVAGPDIYSFDVPDDVSEVAGGIQFVYDYTGTGGGFAPGTDLAPNFTSTLRDEGRYDQASPPYNTDPDEPNTLIPNCAQSSASSPVQGVPDGNAAMPADECPEIEILPIDGGDGVGNLIDKDYGTSSSGGAASVIARSGDTIPSTLSWSTGGYSGFERVEITDVPDPTVDVADTVYDAFNLIRVDAISAQQDPQLTYDQVTSVELWNGTAWVDATNDPCPEACDGTFPGMDLTGAEQASTLAVRLTYAESPTRGARTQGDLDAPPVGSGVARSIGNGRHVTLVWQVRDTKRSDGSPALGEDTYNAGAGLVRNDVNATGFPETGAPVSDNASDTVRLQDVPITTTTQKDWLGGPVAVPSPGTPQAQYPRSRLRVTTTNTTPALVDQLEITDPAPGSTTDPLTDPFDYFRLVRISAITQPAGTQSTTVNLTCPTGPQPAPYTREQALALTVATLPCDVVGVQVLFDGRIASGAAGIVALDVQLRAENRETGDQITPADSPVTNTAQGIVADVDAIGTCPPPDDVRYACDQDTAAIDIVAPTFGVTAGKSISPATQTEGDFSPVTVTVSAQNSGSARPYTDTIIDEDPTFWNAVDFVQMDPSWTLPAPVQYVRACYLSGGSFTNASVAGDTVGGTYTCQEIPGGGPPFEPGDLTLDEAREFIDDAAQTVDIHGLRFDFMASDEVGWQNPANPLIRVPFQVERRTDLRSGGAVPTTRSDQTAAPGEDEAGIFVDTVEVAGQSVLVGPDTRLQADDTADAPYTHDHLTVGVEVDKGPSGQVQPGTVIPFTLTYTNTGEAPLTNPVFTDVLPSDADGPMLIFDPETDPTINSPYSFQLAGAAPVPPNGDPLPTDQDDITITQAGDTITFEMPDGTVLEPGQTYTITIDLMLRPGLTPDDLVTNTDTIVADEPFDPDACSPTYDPVTGECSDETTVSPVRVAALSTIKAVQADVPVDEPGIPEVYLDRNVLPDGSDVPDDYCDTAADADGFYRAPCVPVTYPGDTETWRFTVTNSGTIPLDELVAVDALPIPGDNGVIVTLPRNSEWHPTFADNIELISDNGTAELSVFYTPSNSPCTDDLDPLGDPCPAGSWLPYDNSVDDAQVGSLKFQVDFGADLFDPGEQLAIQFQTTTTPEEPTNSELPVAWNTVATGGASNDNGARETVTATEGRKVGVTYPTGPIELEKIVSGDGAQYAPTSFTVQLACTLNGEPLTGLPEVTLTPGEDPTEVDGLPWGAECTATEADQGQTSEVIGTATVGGPEDEIGLVTVENVFELGDISVAKTVTSAAVDQDGNPITYGPFQVAASCEFLGNEVWADGYDADDPMQTEISDGETWDLTGLPVGAECTITEPDPADASVTITPQTVEVALDDVVTIDVENTFGDGSLHLRKLVAPEAVEDFPISEGPFTLHVACTLTDGSHPDGELVYEDDIVLQGAQPLEATIDNIAAGAVCAVTEPDDGAATVHVITPQTVTIMDDETVNVVATNLFGSGALTVTKTVDGAGAERYGAGPFEVSLTCSYTNNAGDEVPLNTPGGPTRELTADNDYTAQYEPLLFGSTCQIAETQTGGATSTVITNADGEEITEFTVDSLTEDLQIGVTNTFDVGAIRVNKTVVGDGPRRFEVELACTHDVDGTATDVEVPGGADRTLTESGGYTATYDELPAGAQCTLVETDNGRADRTTITPNDGDPEVGTVVVEDGETVSLEVVNEFDAAVAPASIGPDPGVGFLSDTGASRALLPLLVAGVLLVGAGAALVLRGRRRRTG